MWGWLWILFLSRSFWLGAGLNQAKVAGTKHVACTCLRPKKNTWLQEELGDEVASQKNVPASVKASTASSNLNASFSIDALDYSVKVAFYSVSDLGIWDAEGTL